MADVGSNILDGPQAQETETQQETSDSNSDNGSSSSSSQQPITAHELKESIFNDLCSTEEKFIYDYKFADIVDKVKAYSEASDDEDLSPLASKRRKFEVASKSAGELLERLFVSSIHGSIAPVNEALCLDVFRVAANRIKRHLTTVKKEEDKFLKIALKSIVMDDPTPAPAVEVPFEVPEPVAEQAPRTPGLLAPPILLDADLQNTDDRRRLSDLRNAGRVSVSIPPVDAHVLTPRAPTDMVRTAELAAVTPAIGPQLHEKPSASTASNLDVPALDMLLPPDTPEGYRSPVAPTSFSYLLPENDQLIGPPTTVSRAGATRQTDAAPANVTLTAPMTPLGVPHQVVQLDLAQPIFKTPTVPIAPKQAPITSVVGPQATPGSALPVPPKTPDLLPAKITTPGISMTPNLPPAQITTPGVSMAPSLPPAHIIPPTIPDQIPANLTGGIPIDDQTLDEVIAGGLQRIPPGRLATVPQLQASDDLPPLEPVRPSQLPGPPPPKGLIDEFTQIDAGTMSRRIKRFEGQNQNRLPQLYRTSFELKRVEDLMSSKRMFQAPAYSRQALVTDRSPQLMRLYKRQLTTQETESERDGVPQGRNQSTGDVSGQPAVPTVSTVPDLPTLDEIAGPQEAQQNIVSTTITTTAVAQDTIQGQPILIAVTEQELIQFPSVVAPQGEIPQVVAAQLGTRPSTPPSAAQPAVVGSNLDIVPGAASDALQTVMPAMEAEIRRKTDDILERLRSGSKAATVGDLPIGPLPVNLPVPEAPGETVFEPIVQIHVGEPEPVPIQTLELPIPIEIERLVQETQPVRTEIEHLQPVPVEVEHPQPVPVHVEHLQPINIELEHPLPVPEVVHLHPVPAEVEHPQPVPEVEHPQPVPTEVEHPQPVPTEVEHPQPVPTKVEHPQPAGMQIEDVVPQQAQILVEDPPIEGIRQDVGHPEVIPREPMQPQPVRIEVLPPTEVVELPELMPPVPLPRPDLCSYTAVLSALEAKWSQGIPVAFSDVLGPTYTMSDAAALACTLVKINAEWRVRLVQENGEIWLQQFPSDFAERQRAKQRG